MSIFPFSLGYKPILRLLLVHRNQAIWRCSLVIFGLLASSPVRSLRRTQGRSPFHPRQTSSWKSLSSGPSASRNTFSVSTITDGNARGADCILSRVRAEEYDRPVTQSIATPEPSSRTIPTLDRTLVAR